MNLYSTIRLLAFITLFVAFFMAIPMFMALHMGEMTSAFSFMLTLGIMLLLGLTIIIATQRKHSTIKITVRASYLFVTLTWLSISFFGALPLYLSHTMENFSLSFFEIMSGFTTTGATAMNNIELADKSILFWRNMTNWLGGMGIVVLFIAVLPAFGVRGSALVGAETVGPTKDKLTPQIQYTAIALWSIYLGLTVLQIILLLFGKLSLYDAITVAFGTMGAAGFTVRNSSIAAYNSPYVEWICIIFMFLAGMNFALYFKVLQGKYKRALKDGEFRIYGSITLIAILLITFNLLSNGYRGFFSSLRAAAFQAVSFITTTGFSSTSYTAWPIFSKSILLSLCLIGGCSGSTAGGIKIARVAAIAKIGKNAIVKRIHPNAITNITLGEETISKETIYSIAGFIGLYIITIFIGTIVISLSNYDLITCLISTILCLGNIGTGLGSIGTTTTFAIYPDWTLWVFSSLMLAGRLELFTVYALFTKSFWKR